MKTILFSILLILFTTFSVMADRLDMSYLEIKEIKSQYYSVLFKLPIKDDKKLQVDINMPNGCYLASLKKSYLVKQTHLDSWQIKCDKSLEGVTLVLKGLNDTNTELLLRIEFLSSESYSSLLGATKSSYIIPKEVSYWQIIQTYTWLGVTHILLGFDHLLFVFALLLIVKNISRLLWTITAFTLAHSLTMAGATLGIIHVPQAPVEAIIALSILFLAMEIMHEKQGKVGITARHPWLIAFIFGLLHGFGFAGALSEIGLPQHAITLALIFFNIGVELGQLLFIVTAVVLIRLLQRLNYPTLLNKLQTIVVYAIGSLSAFWLIERSLSF
jgi:hydrogenase/urease accessory protein HupE